MVTSIWPCSLEKLQGHARFQGNVRRNLGAGHGEDQFRIGVAVGLIRRNGHGDGFPGFMAFHSGLEARDQHALAQGEFQGVALPGGIENRAVSQCTGVVHTHRVAFLMGMGTP